MKSDDKICFHGSVAFLAPEKKNRASAIRLRLERNPFLEEPPGLLESSPYEQRLKLRRDRTKIFLKACFKEAMSVFGEEEARQLFAEAAPKRKRGGQEGKTRSPLLADLPAVLLQTYYEVLQDEDTPKAEAVGKVAKQLFAKDRMKYGHSKAAIERHLRRLLNKQKRRSVEAAEEHQRLLDAYKRQTGQDFPQGLLAGTQGLVADNE